MSATGSVFELGVIETAITNGRWPRGIRSTRFATMAANAEASVTTQKPSGTMDSSYRRSGER